MTERDAEVFAVADEAFRRLNHTGGDGRLVWQVAALVVDGHVSAAVLWSACRAVHLAAARSPIGYFRKCITEDVSRRGGDLERLLRSKCRLPAGCPDGRPEAASRVRELTAGLFRPVPQ